MKLLMAVFVVGIHTNPFMDMQSETVSKLFDSLFALAVPFFFIASGFFLYSKIVDAPLLERLGRIEKWWKRIAKLYLVWTLLYLPFTIYGFCLDHLSPFQAILLFLKNVLLVGQNYGSWPLWYLLAMLVAGGIIYIMEKCHFNYSGMLVTAITLTGIGSVLDLLHTEVLIREWWTPFVDLYYKLFLHTRNGFFQGLIFMVLGVGVAKYKQAFPTKWILPSLLLFGAAYLNDVFGVKYLFYLSLFMLSLQCNLKGETSFYQNIRITSTIIYFVHMFFVGAFTLLFKENINSFLLFSSVLCGSFLSSFVLLNFKGKKWFNVCFN